MSQEHRNQCEGNLIMQIQYNLGTKMIKHSNEVKTIGL